jgi:hypothetical protein
MERLPRKAYTYELKMEAGWRCPFNTVLSFCSANRLKTSPK